MFAVRRILSQTLNEVEGLVVSQVDRSGRDCPLTLPTNLMNAIRGWYSLTRRGGALQCP